MTRQDAQIVADMANAAEVAILDRLSKENPVMLDWYMNLPRERRVEIAMNAAAETVRELQ